jgi:hypothetical protein
MIPVHLATISSIWVWNFFSFARFWDFDNPTSKKNYVFGIFGKYLIFLYLWKYLSSSKEKAVKKTVNYTFGFTYLFNTMSLTRIIFLDLRALRVGPLFFRHPWNVDPSNLVFVNDLFEFHFNFFSWFLDRWFCYPKLGSCSNHCC